MKVLNFGSLNLDYVYQVDHFTKPGETQSAFSQTVNPGGKGLNQSIALKKAGIDVYHAGCVGKGGQMLKKIGTASRLEAEKLLGKKTNLRLWVKVKKGWRDDEKKLRSFGFRLERR